MKSQHSNRPRGKGQPTIVGLNKRKWKEGIVRFERELEREEGIGKLALGTPVRVLNPEEGRHDY